MKMARSLQRLLKVENFFIFKFKTPVYFPNIKYATPAKVTKKLDSEGPVYKKTDHEHKISRKTTVRTLEQLLNIKRFDALDVVLNNKRFCFASKALLEKNYNLYVQKEIHHETLKKYPELLTVFESEWKIKETQKLMFDINDVAVLLLLPTQTLIKFIKKELKEPEGKIVVLSSLLNISPQKACECIARKDFLCAISCTKIKNNLKILLEYGITSDSICNDLWVLKYSKELIQSQLNIAKERNIDTLKTWMVRVAPKAFETHIQRHSDTKSILGEHSLVEYLSERLQCSIDFSNYIILKQPVLKNKSMKKLKELIDFLYAQGFKSHQICRVPKILVHSVETIRKRLKLLEDKGIQIDGLSLLTKSQNQFMQCYEVLVKSKNKSKSRT